MIHKPKILKIKSNKILLSVFVLFGLLSCSQNVPELKTVTTTAILDYATETSYPTARLSFFIETNSEVKRADSIEAYSKKYGYTWKTDNLIKIATSKKQWAGYTNFAIPETLSIPDGGYEVKYITADGEIAEANAYVNLDSKLLQAKADEIPEIMNEKHGRLNVAVFDKENNLIIYGEKVKDLRSEESILRKYKESVYYREVWATSGNSTLCLMPIVYLKK